MTVRVDRPSEAGEYDPGMQTLLQLLWGELVERVLRLVGDLDHADSSLELDLDGTFGSVDAGDGGGRAENQPALVEELDLNPHPHRRRWWTVESNWAVQELNP